MLLAGTGTRARVHEALGAVRAAVADADERELPVLFAQASADLLRSDASPAEAWVDFELRSAEYYSLLAELSGSGPDRDAAEGFLPAAIADRVRALRLDDTFLRVSLRGYQAFGARFALAQKRVIIGDEMGLGKTVQAIAALAHLACRRDPLPRGLPRQRADQLDPRDPGPLHPARRPRARYGAGRGVRGLAGGREWR